MSEQTTDKQRGWFLPASRGQVLKAGLYIVSTPIGNMGDLSLRALDTLAAVDAVLCEDTRVSGKLLSYYSIKKKLDIYNDHSDDGKRAAIIKRIEGGASLALMSDAGTPLISDPGYKLVEELKAKGLLVTSIPGANAPLTALQLSGLPSDKFTFLGFLPPKSGARQALLKEWADVPSTLIAFETAPRLLKALEDILVVMGNRRVAVTRELTKMFEEVVCENVSDLIAHYEKQGLPKGEIVLVIEKPEEKIFDQASVDKMIVKALKTMSTKDAAAAVCEQTGQPKKELYARALELSKDE
jgi:16S rRNA (cytidine1402-2'-O)-methyltransferase